MITYHITNNQASSSFAFQDYLKTRLSKVEGLLENAEATATIDLERADTDKEFELTIKLIVPNLRPRVPEKIYKATAKHEDAYAAVDLVEDKLRRQIKKTLTTINRDDRRTKKLLKTM